MLHVGQRVVCINDENLRFHCLIHGESYPVKGGEYTIRAIALGQVMLHEIRNAPRQYQDGYGEALFGAYRFRPIVTRKTDIAVFTALLNPQKADA